MKRIRITSGKGKMEWDFDGFKEKECEIEEAALRYLLAKMGLQTAVDSQKEKKNGEKEACVEAEKVRA